MKYSKYGCADNSRSLFQPRAATECRPYSTFVVMSLWRASRLSRGLMAVRLLQNAGLLQRPARRSHDASRYHRLQCVALESRSAIDEARARRVTAPKDP